MSIISVTRDLDKSGSWPSATVLDDNFELHRKIANYEIRWSIGADSVPDVAFQAQRIHGSSYVESEYFNDLAIDEHGRLLPELDGTRERDGWSARITYMLAVPKGGAIEDGEATARMIDIGEGGDISDLPAFKYFAESDSGIEQVLRQTIETYGASSVREVAALGSIGRNGHLGSHEIMRSIIQNAVRKKRQLGHGEIYLTALTEKSIRPIIRFVGDSAATVIGEPTRIYASDERAGLIHVSPVLIDPSRIIDGLVSDLGDCEVGSRPYEMLRHRILFLADGLSEEELGQDTVSAIRSTHQ